MVYGHGFKTAGAGRRLLVEMIPTEKQAVPQNPRGTTQDGKKKSRIIPGRAAYMTEKKYTTARLNATKPSVCADFVQPTIEAISILFLGRTKHYAVNWL